MRSLLLAGSFVALTFLPAPSDRAARAREVPDLATFLALRAALPGAEAPGVEGAAPALVTAPFGARALALLYGDLAARTDLALDPSAGPISLAARDVEPRGGAPVALLARGASLGADATVALAEACARAGLTGVVALDGGAPGQGPYGQLAVLERLASRELAAAVAVFDLERDLADADVVRRVHTNAVPQGDVDALWAALRDPARRAAAQEAWLAAEPLAPEEVVETLTRIGRELDRRAWLMGGTATVVLLEPRSPLGPATRDVVDQLVAGLAAHGVASTRVAPTRDADGVVRDEALPALLAEALARGAR